MQEVEDIDTLKQFNRDLLSGMYPYVGLIEGNDERLIDVAILSRLPIGAMTSWQHAVHAADPNRRVFSRDLLEVEIFDPSRSRKLLTIFNNHLKSRFIEYGEDPVLGEQQNNLRRSRQAEKVAEIVKMRTDPAGFFAILGDLNDPPDSQALQALVADPQLNLVNALANPQETRPAKPDNPPPPGPAWTHRYKPSGQPAEYLLFDQIWVSPALAAKQQGAWIDRRTRHGGDGSDHDPAWIKVRL